MSEKRKKKIEKEKKKLRAAFIALGIYAVILIAAIILVDNRRAEVTLKGEQDVTVEYGTQYSDPGAEAHSVGSIFGAGSRPLTVSTTGSADTGRLGTYIIEYDASYLGSVGRAFRSVTVVDTTPPEIELVHSDTTVHDWFTGYTEEGFTARDNCDGDITDRVEREEFPDRVIYTVSDSSGNSATVERELNVDLTAPAIILSGPADMQVSAAFEFTDPGFSAMDGTGRDLSELVKVEGSVIPYVPGTYQLSYSIVSNTGDSRTAVRNVTVVPVERPEIVEPTSKTIYLTFDDGPGPYTSKLLDVLAAYDVKATFFVTGINRKYSDMIGRAYREGHSIAIHTNSHDYYSVYASEQAFFDDFMAAEELVYEQTGTYTRLFRFPGGSSNTVSSFNPGIMSRLAKAMGDMGYKYFDWNVSSGDAGETTRTDKVIENVKNGVSGKAYSIVLQHDIKDYSVAAVESIIRWGLNNGYTFAALDMTSPEAHHGIAN